MKNLPLVSVLLPVYNAQDFIDESIKSILTQTYTNWELLICDDASTDLTFERIDRIVKHDSRVRTFRNRSNLKLLKTRNRLLELARGEFITFQDADDYSDKFRIEKMVEAFQADSKLGLLSSQIGYINARGRLFRISRKPTDYAAILGRMYRENVVGGSNMMLKREALQSVGGKFRTYFDGLSYQDYDLSFLIAEKYECRCLPEVLYFYRQHEKSNSKMISIDRMLAKEIVIHLARQRKSLRYDDLLNGHPEKVDAYFAELREPYVKDPSLVFREFAANYMYSRLNTPAIRASWLAVIRSPTKWVNWRTLQYCLRKSLLGAIREFKINWF